MQATDQTFKTVIACALLSENICRCMVCIFIKPKAEKMQHFNGRKLFFRTWDLYRMSYSDQIDIKYGIMIRRVHSLLSEISPLQGLFSKVGKTLKLWLL